MIEIKRSPRLNRGTAQGQMVFWDNTLKKWTYTETSELFWDDVNKYLGIGTASPSEKLHVVGNIFLGRDNDKALFGTGKDMSIYYDGTDGWIKTDLIAPSDLNISCGNAKTLELQESVWDDLNFDPERSSGPVATRPDEITINNNYYSEFTSANNQLCGSSEEIPHEYKLSTNLLPHIHIFLKSGESAGTTGVTFTVYWQLRLPTGTTNGSVTLTATSAELGTTAGGNNFVIYDATGFAGPSTLEGQLALTIARTAGDAGDIIVLTYGVHFQIDTIGSRQVNAK